jgi:hypothetical protein
MYISSIDKSIDNPNKDSDKSIFSLLKNHQYIPDYYGEDGQEPKITNRGGMIVSERYFVEDEFVIGRPRAWEKDFIKSLKITGWKSVVGAHTDNPHLPYWVAPMGGGLEKWNKARFKKDVRQRYGNTVISLFDYLVLLNNEGFIFDEITSDRILELDNSNLLMMYPTPAKRKILLEEMMSWKGLPFKRITMSNFYAQSLIGEHQYFAESGLINCDLTVMPIHTSEETELRLGREETTLMKCNLTDFVFYIPTPPSEEVGYSFRHTEYIPPLVSGGSMETAEKKGVIFMSKKKGISVEEYSSRLDSEELASIVIMFENTICKNIILPSTSYVLTESEDFEAVIDVSHPNHRFVVRNLFLSAVKSAGLQLSVNSEWSYRIIVRNGTEYESEGVMNQLGDTLFFDVKERGGVLRDNGSCRL